MLKSYENLNNINLLHYYLNEFYKKGINANIINEFLDVVIPKSNEGVNYIKSTINIKGRITAMFIPTTQTINVSVLKLTNWLDANSISLCDYYNIKDKEQFKNYLLLMALIHEIEHSYQYIISINKMEMSSSVLQSSYRLLFDLFQPNNSIIPHPIQETKRIVSLILYKKNENMYLLERNAQVETLDLLVKLTSLNKNENLNNIFNNMLNKYISIGYLNNQNGCVEETLKKTLLIHKIKNITDGNSLNNEQKIKFGLSIDEEVRQKILKK